MVIPSLDGLPGAEAEARQDLLSRAARLRDQRDSVVAALGDGGLLLVDLLAWGRTHGDVGHIKIVTVLQAVPTVGKVRARRVLAGIGIEQTREVAGLSDTETAALLAAVR